ncbi:ABC transporter substrate-binding protein [Aquipuribacter sp. MA13-6]|uniref:ABC transporter substrate-binding protein n=1 Tax=unclassified Aquipuribacter TaxID=2635084 RepID=UPI003EEFEF0E
MMPPRRAALLAGALAAALLAAACGSSATDPETSPAPSAAAADPGTGSVTIEHAFGETTVEGTPERVVTLGWGSTDAALALGVVPVAIPLATYGADENGLLPWVAQALEEQGAETPELLPDADGVPFEQVAAQQPDVILAVYSGITAEDYATLSEIAPTVAYPDQAWSTPWRDVVTTVGEALGASEEAAAVVEAADAEVAAAAEAHPELAGRTVAAVLDTPDALYVYEEADPRVEFLTDLGLEVAPSVEELSTGEATFYFTLSPELVGGLTSDVLLSYSDSPEAAADTLAKPYLASLPQVQSGAVASIEGQALVSSVSPPTALSLSYGLQTYVEELSQAVANAG